LRKGLVVCGCGAGDGVRKVLPKLLSHVPRLVLDADALNAIASDTSLQNQLTARAGRGHVTLMTPHPLEAARLLGCSTAQVQADRIGTAARLANGFNAVIVLKGSGSVIAAPGRTPHLNPTGNPALASAGTGDVLAGWLGGSWSQGRTGERPQADDIRRPPPAGDEQSGKATFAHEGVDAAFDAACAAAYLHGLAAEGIRAGPLRAADLIERMHQIVRTSIA
jgi:NAD(P)H-hydrate repair Nnr-like enzyme with NAD(P)H-hydrate dehydratase domain